MIANGVYYSQLSSPENSKYPFPNCSKTIRKTDDKKYSRVLGIMNASIVLGQDYRTIAAIEICVIEKVTYANLRTLGTLVE